MLNTIYQIAATIAALIPVLGFAWWLVSPRFKSMARQVEPDPAKHVDGEQPAPTMREMQEEQTETMHRMESKLDKRLNEFGLRLAVVEAAVKPVSGLIEKVDNLIGRVEILENAKK